MRCRSLARLGAIWRTSLIESWGAEQQVIQRWVTTNAEMRNFQPALTKSIHRALGEALFFVEGGRILVLPINGLSLDTCLRLQILVERAVVDGVIDRVREDVLLPTLRLAFCT